MQPNGTPEGLQTLNDFVGGSDVEVAIAGYSQSTEVTSLLEAFKSLNITATLPALKTESSRETAHLSLLSEGKPWITGMNGYIYISFLSRVPTRSTTA